MRFIERQFVMRQKFAGLLLTSRAYLPLELEELQVLQDNLNRFQKLL